MRLSEVLFELGEHGTMPSSTLWASLARRAQKLEDETARQLDDDVRAFQRKFGYDAPLAPRSMDVQLGIHRLRLMREEVAEFETAVARGDFNETVDACVDIVYVAVGTLVSMGVPFRAEWDRVQTANMKKQKTPERYGKPAKPDGWKEPDHDVR